MRHVPESELERRIRLILKSLQNSHLREEPFTWVRAISKDTGLHPEIVNRMLENELKNHVEIVESDALIERGLKIKPIRLKPGSYSPERIVMLSKLIKEFRESLK